MNTTIETHETTLERLRAQAREDVLQKTIADSNSRAISVERRLARSCDALDARIVDFDRPVHFIRRNAWTVAAILAVNAVVTVLLIHFSR